MTLERKLILGFVGVLLGFAALVAFISWSALRSAAEFRLIDRTHQVLTHLERTSTAVLRVQLSSHGHLLTGQPKQLEAHASALRQLEESFVLLARLTADNPDQQQRLVHIRRLISDLTAVTAHRNHVRQEQEQPADADGAPGETQRTLSQIGLLIQAMEEAERTLLVDHFERYERSTRRTVVTIGIGAALAAALLASAVRQIVLDYRQRRRAERELNDFFQLSLDPLAMIDADGRFLRLNRAWETVLGAPTATLLGRRFMEFVHPDDALRTEAETRAIAAGQASPYFENRYRTQTGEWRWLQWQAAASEDRRLIYAAARDITAQRLSGEQIHRLNHDLQLQNTRLEAANQELEAFSYSVSHDLRAPLRHIDGFASLLTKHAGAALDDKGRRHLAVISEAARKMGRLIDDLLSFSRMGRAQVKATALDHDALLAEVLRDGHYYQNSRVTWDLAPLPPVFADPALLRQVWINYLDNAVKYSAPAPQPKIAIRGHLDHAAAEAIFSVQDNGVGFDMRYAAKLFGVFQRLHAESEFPGTGIGLANVRRIVARHGGRTWAESAPGAGATFFFSLPIVPASPHAT